MFQNYKIFLRDTAIELGYSEASNRQASLISPPEDVIQFVESFNPTMYPNGIIMKGGADNLYNYLLRFLHLIESSGGIVWKPSGELLMIFRRGKWDLPKGKIEMGESTEVAALREVGEEAGAGKLRIIQKFKPTYHIYKEMGKWILKKTFWFEMLCFDEGDLKPQVEEGITSVEWIPYKKIQEKLINCYPSINELLQNVLLHSYMAEKMNNY